MKKPVTIDDLLEIAAFAEGLKNKAINLIERMKEEQKPNRSRGMSSKRMAELTAMREKVWLKNSMSS